MVVRLAFDLLRWQLGGSIVVAIDDREDSRATRSGRKIGVKRERCVLGLGGSDDAKERRQREYYRQAALASCHHLTGSKIAHGPPPNRFQLGFSRIPQRKIEKQCAAPLGGALRWINWDVDIELSC